MSKGMRALVGAAVLGVAGATGLVAWVAQDTGPGEPRPAVTAIMGLAARGDPSEAVASGGSRTPGPTPGLPTGAAAIPMQATTPEAVREVVRLTRDATWDAVPDLRLAALESADSLVVGHAVQALGRLGRFSDDAELLALLDDARPRVRQDAVKACGLDGRPSTLPRLEQILVEGDETLSPLALDALGKIGGGHARELVEQVADDPLASRTERAFARAALERMNAHPLAPRPRSKTF